MLQPLRLRLPTVVLVRVLAFFACVFFLLFLRLVGGQEAEGPARSQTPFGSESGYSHRHGNHEGATRGGKEKYTLGDFVVCSLFLRPLETPGRASGTI